MYLRLLLSSALIFVAAGCVQSQPNAAYYQPPPLSPTSDRSSPRIYAPADASVSGAAAVPPNVKNSDVILAQNISELLKGNTRLADISANVLATVENGIVTLRGTVPAQNAREEIVERILKTPWVHQVNDHLGVEGER